MSTKLPKHEEQALAHLLNLQLELKKLVHMSLKASLAFLKKEATPAQLAQQVLDIEAASNALPIDKTLNALAHLAHPEGLTLHAREQWVWEQNDRRIKRQRHARQSIGT